MTREPGECAPEERDGASCALVGKDLGVAEAGVVVGSDVDELEALLPGAVGTAAGDAVADAIESSQALHIEVK